MERDPALSTMPAFFRGGRHSVRILATSERRAGGSFNTACIVRTGRAVGLRNASMSHHQNSLQMPMNKLVAVPDTLACRTGCFGATMAM